MRIIDKTQRRIHRTLLFLMAAVAVLAVAGWTERERNADEEYTVYSAYLPEGLLNYLALLGWGIADDHDVFSLDEMVAAFDVKDVNSNPARFDQKKADALNAEHIRLLSEADFTARLHDYFAVHGHGNSRGHTTMCSKSGRHDAICRPEPTKRAISRSWHSA